MPSHEHFIGGALCGFCLALFLMGTMGAFQSPEDGVTDRAAYLGLGHYVHDENGDRFVFYAEEE